jgi:cysteine-rich repeat protein
VQNKRRKPTKGGKKKTGDSGQDEGSSGEDEGEEEIVKYAAEVLEEMGFPGVVLLSSTAFALDGTELSPLICGDGITQKELEEECDDANTLDGDGCSSDCIVERDWHCFHCQIEDSLCNGTENGPKEGCLFKGCSVGLSLCRKMGPCTLWYGRCYQRTDEAKGHHKCWSCMQFDPLKCLDCTPGYTIKTPQELSRTGDDKPWALTRGNLLDQPLPKWYAPYGYRGPCESDPTSRGKKGPHPTATQLHPESSDFPEDPSGNSGGGLLVYGMPAVCNAWTESEQVVHNIFAFLFLVMFLSATHFCFQGSDHLIARQKRAISRPDLPRPKIWRPTVVPGEDDLSSDEMSDMAEEEEVPLMDHA